MVRAADECQAGPPRVAPCQRACELNHSNSCARWGHATELAGDRAGALALHERACRGGSGIGCDAAARLSEAGDPDAARRFAIEARQYHRVHCEQGYIASCLGLAEMFRLGRGGPVDAAVAAHYRRRACQLGEASACDGPPVTPRSPPSGRSTR